MKSISQNNLVINGDFETILNCNFFLGQIDPISNWNSPTIGTPDYFNVCAVSAVSSAGIPKNDLGYQNAHSGDGYAGLVLYGFFNGMSDLREYIQGQFITKLIQNRHYYFSAFINPADIPLDLSYYVSVNKIGVYFSDTSFYDSMNLLLPNLPHIHADSTFLYNDTLNWMKISGYYQAKGGEQYITIGNFSNNLHTTTALIASSNILPLNFCWSYYYIDDVSLICLDCDSTSSLSFPNIFSPNYDGVNDEFYPGAKNIELYNCKIFNRLGGEVAELLTPNQKWNGLGKFGDELPEGIYYYLASAKGKDGVEYKRKGFVELVR